MNTTRSLRGSTVSKGYRSGERAREELLGAAGEVFAEKGYDRATSREICERAGMNLAAVNYHFGGIDGLYIETLRLAHQGFVTVEFVRQIVESDRTPKEKLLAYLGPIVRWLANPAARPWQMRLVAREMLSPSGLREAILSTEIQPKTDFLRDIIAELIGAKPDEPVVGQAALTVVAPTTIMATATRAILETLAPGAGDPVAKAEALAQHYERFILGGLDAVAQAHKVAAAEQGQPISKTVRVGARTARKPSSRRQPGRTLKSGKG